MTGAHHGVLHVVDLALGQRAAFVRTLVAEGEQLVLDVGDRHAAGRQIEGPELALGDLRQRSHPDEVHASPPRRSSFGNTTLVPELPEVETYRRFFAERAVGRTVHRVVVTDRTIVRNASARAFARALAGRTFLQADRQGKWMLARTEGPTLLVHFGMTGDLIWSGDEPQRHRHDRVILELVGGHELRYRNVRKLGGVWLAHDADEEREVLGDLGPDALAAGRREFVDRLSRRRGGAKALLMNQRFVAGVGNLIADEVLWQARIHPKRRVESLDAADRARLFRVLRKVLTTAVQEFDYLESRPAWLNHVRGEPGARCPRCRAPLARVTAAGRTTYLCPRCQPPPA